MSILIWGWDSLSWNYAYFLSSFNLKSIKMKNLKSLFIIFFVTLLSQYIYSAEYLGKNIDGIEYDCTAYSYSTAKYYYVTVEFSGDEATITFSNG